MTERRRTMDYMGILKEAWGVTRRNKRLWILGLFAAGTASVSTNWNSSSSSSSGSKGLPPGWENIHTPNEALQRGLDLAGKQLHVSLGTAAQWWPIIGMAVLTLIVVVHRVLGYRHRRTRRAHRADARSDRGPADECRRRVAERSALLGSRVRGRVPAGAAASRARHRGPDHGCGLRDSRALSREAQRTPRDSRAWGWCSRSSVLSRSWSA